MKNVTGISKKVQLKIRDINETVGSNSVAISIVVSYKDRQWDVNFNATLTDGIDKSSGICFDGPKPVAVTRALEEYVDSGLAFEEALKTKPSDETLYHLRALQKRLLSEFDGNYFDKVKLDTILKLLNGNSCQII
jgi:hypothetical protein